MDAQECFGSVDPEILGACHRTLHNVVGDIGVLQGHPGDLQLGLPPQSVAVMPDEQADAVLAGLREHFEDRSGVMFASDAYVSRPDHFR